MGFTFQMQPTFTSYLVPIRLYLNLLARPVQNELMAAFYMLENDIDCICAVVDEAGSFIGTRVSGCQGMYLIKDQHVPYARQFVHVVTTLVEAYAGSALSADPPKRFAYCEANEVDPYFVSGLEWKTGKKDRRFLVRDFELEGERGYPSSPE